MENFKVDITLRINLRDFGAFEDLVNGLGNDPEIKAIKPVSSLPVDSVPVKNLRRRVNEQDIKEMHHMLDVDGLSTAEVAAATGWSNATVLRVQRGELKPPDQSKRVQVTPQIVRAVRKARKNNPNLTLRDVAAQLPDKQRIGASTVGQVLNGKYDHLLT
jgi:hypothetical protein